MREFKESKDQRKFTNRLNSNRIHTFTMLIVHFEQTAK